MQPAQHPSAGVPLVYGAAAATAASPSWSSSSHVQVQSDTNQKDAWNAVSAARAAMKKHAEESV